MSECVEIVLRDDQIAFADRLARRRQDNADAHGIKSKRGAETGPVSLAIHEMGARAEMAACLYLFSGPPAPWNYMAINEPDFAGFVDVKACSRRSYSLIVLPYCPDEWAHLLVVAEHHPRYLITGWTWAYEAKQPKFLRNPNNPHASGPAYFVPQGADIMKPPGDLRALVQRMGSNANDPASICHVQGCGERRHPSLRI